MSLKTSGRSLALTAGLAFLVGLTGGCGGSSDDDATAPAAAATAVATSAASVAEEPACGDAQPEIEASLTGMGSITSVEVPSCDKAVVKTSLTADQADIAAGICMNAATEASGHGVAAVSIVSADGTELATGTTAADCKAV